MNNAQKHFSRFLINLFYEDLQSDLENWSAKLAQGAEIENQKDIEQYYGLIKKTRKILKVIECDENQFLKEYFEEILKFEIDENV